MGSTGLLPYVHGIDFSYNDFNDQTFQGRLGQLQSLRWVNLDNMKLCKLPNDLFKLHKLEYLSVANNQLLSIHGDLSNLPALRSINFSRNRLKNYGIPSDLFSIRDLSVVDMSHNELIDVPNHIEDASSLLILNLSYNGISKISGDVLKSLIGLVYLNLGHNKFENIPPQLRRLLHLKVLILSGNPLAQSQLRQISGLRSLQTLELNNTFRTDQNLPSNLNHLSNLTKIDLSCNQLTKIPDCLYELTKLVHINLSDNNISTLTSNIKSFSQLEYLNLSRNSIAIIPISILKLLTLKVLFLSGNKLDQTGLPSGINKLVSLLSLNLSDNNFVSLPDSLFRCKNLKTLNVSINKLKTLPVAFHRRRDINIDYTANPDLILPPHPPMEKPTLDPSHGIDFSLNTQLEASGVLTPKPVEVKLTGKELIKKRLKLLRSNDSPSGDSSEKVLEGLKMSAERSQNTATTSDVEIKKRWDENLERPNIDYSNIFEPHVGQTPGLIIFEMNEFYPVELNPELFGHFFLGDCYLILETTCGEKGDISHEIFFLIGTESSIDKKSAAAIHAVNLRNFLNSSSRTHREEMGDESEEFVNLMERMGLSIHHISGENALTGLFSSVGESFSASNKCYLLILKNLNPHAISVPLSALLMRERPGIYLLEMDSVIYIYPSGKFSDFLISKARLIGENISKHEYKSRARVVTLSENDLAELVPEGEYNSDEIDQLMEHDQKLYQVNFNKRFLELPQVSIGSNPLKKELLNTNNVYILDTITVVYVWKGRKSPILLCNAGLKLSEELFIMIPRPKHSSIKFFKEGDETLIFKSYFEDWESFLSLGAIIRTPVGSFDVVESGENGGEKTQIAKEKMKSDLSALFYPRKRDLTDEECDSLILDYKENCELLIAYVFDRRKFVNLPKEEYGNFRDDICYLFVCSVVNFVDEEEEVLYRAYFWEGNHAPVGAWLQFLLSLKPTMEKTLKTSLDVVKLEQQKEDLRFLALFDRHFVIYSGSVNDQTPQMFVLRATAGTITLRCIQVDVHPQNLNSNLCCLLVVPFEGDVVGVVYVWIGQNASVLESEIAENIAHKNFGSRGYALNVVDEGNEPDNYFWEILGGRTDDYAKEGYFLKDLRLFRAFSLNDCFTVVEKYSDFSKNDLSDKFPMILDDGKHVFVWFPTEVNAVDVRLALNSSSVYTKHLGTVQVSKPRKIVIQRQHKESNLFKRCFHGWSLNVE